MLNDFERGKLSVHAANELSCLEAERDRAQKACEQMGRRIALLEDELARVRKAHQSILNEILYGGTDLSDEPDIDRIHDFSKVGLRDMTAEKENT